jgi:hypothetical protein
VTAAWWLWMGWLPTIQRDDRWGYPKYYVHVHWYKYFGWPWRPHTDAIL